MRYLKIVIVNILIFFTLFCIAEVAFRILDSDYYFYKSTYPDETKLNSCQGVSWTEPNEHLGWVSKNEEELKFANFFYNQLKIKYKINKQGFRNRVDFDSLKPSNLSKKVLLLGDSFMMSIYQNEQYTIPSNLARQSSGSIEFFNLGVAGYGIDQMFLSYKKFEKYISPNYVVLFFIDDDIPRVLEAYREVEDLKKPSFEVEDNKLLLRKNNKKGLIIKAFETSYILNRFYKKYLRLESVKITKQIFCELKKLTENRNQKLIIIRCPTIDSFNNNYNFEKLSFTDFCNTNNIEYFELYKEMKYLSKDTLNSLYLLNDGHPSKRGATYFAKRISSYIK